ncbi:MAG: hypothetical protein CVV27_02415 [Candidatus Melainabacteria bacterium HGW-Melainabacteria-1]|nr:MAG: hypothetical protein CVV27_02415 [Candidatus Melainabacteria bacterium HGW-Melainabacteria-1]
MPNYDCPISDAELGLLLTPDDDPDFVNNDYEEPLRQPAVWVQALAYVGEDSFDFARHLVSDSYSDDWLWGTRSTCKFQIDDNNQARSNLPCKLARGQKFIFKDMTGTRVIGWWIVRGAPKTPYGKRRVDGTYMGLLNVECVDAWDLMERRTYNHVYTGQHAGAILADAFARAGFDVSGIDVTAGPILESLPVNEDYPSAVAEQMMSLLDWSYWFDIQHDPPKPYAGPKDSELVRIDYEINEDNLYKVFSPDEFELAPASEDYANEITFVYRRKYSKGSANFQENSDVVLGFTGDEDWYQLDITQGADLVNLETDTVHPLKDNNSVAGGANELILSSNYTDVDANDVEYEIRGITHKIKRRNSTAVAQQAALTGGSGVVSKVIVRNDAAFTYAEADLIANFELSLYSRDYWRGGGLIKTSYQDSHRADWILFWPGKTLFFNLEDSHGVVAFVRIEGMRRRMLTSPQRFADGSKSPAFEIELQWTPSLYEDREQIRAIFRSQRKIASTNDSYVTATEFVENILALKDCAHIVPPVQEADASILELDATGESLAYPDETALTDYSMTYQPGYIAVTAG